ncbi:hypothetical protein CFAM422_002850 [Trichoderma lentiforme]|uniref:Uncharacterized protein n=1 Tax=Trichoderma lentiforme TaxID=1567552 RepID=A0A9P4XLM4_9HYPO|nr:hypothetical protein CFAM422_002850 [Trichoderma lentiforme]
MFLIRIDLEREGPALDSEKRLFPPCSLERIQIGSMEPPMSMLISQSAQLASVGIARRERRKLGRKKVTASSDWWGDRDEVPRDNAVRV